MNPLQIRDILRCILKYTSRSDLANHRLVSKLWHSVMDLTIEERFREIVLSSHVRINVVQRSKNMFSDASQSLSEKRFYGFLSVYCYDEDCDVVKYDIDATADHQMVLTFNGKKLGRFSIDFERLSDSEQQKKIGQHVVIYYDVKKHPFIDKMFTIQVNRIIVLKTFIFSFENHRSLTQDDYFDCPPDWRSIQKKKKKWCLIM